MLVKTWLLTACGTGFYAIKSVKSIIPSVFSVSVELNCREKYLSRRIKNWEFSVPFWDFFVLGNGRNLDPHWISLIFCVHVICILKMCMKKSDAEKIFFDKMTGF